MGAKVLIVILSIVAVLGLAIVTIAGDGTQNFSVINETGDLVFLSHSNGVVEIRLRCFYVGSCDIVGGGDCIQVASCPTPPTHLPFKDDAGNTVAYIDENGVFCSEGDIDQNHAMSGVCATPSFNITDDVMDTQSCIDNNGNFYARGNIFCGTCGADCGAGVCSGLGICDTGEDCDNNNDCISASCTASTCDA